MSQKRKIVYVARDIERALGVMPSASYVVVSNRTPYAESIKDKHPEFVHLVDARGGDILDTPELLKSDTVQDLMADKAAALIVFKNNALIETIAKENGWKFLNPSDALAEKVENKITQVKWLGALAAKYLPPHEVVEAKKLVWKKEPLVVQWAHGHTGEGTSLVNSADELKALQKKFPDREARATVFVRGPSFTVNVVVGKDSVLVGNPSYQITGLPPFTDQPFATVGNDWSLTHSLLSEAEIAEMEKMAHDIGEKLRADGWRGLFGIDAMRDDDLNRIFLIEINARQPASAVFESAIQEENRRQGIQGLTIFEAHLRALVGDDIGGKDHPLVPVNDGAQIVQRVSRDIQEMPDDVVGSLELAGYNAIAYENTEHNEDLLRVQSMMGIMETHGRLNARGKEIDAAMHDL